MAEIRALPEVWLRGPVQGIQPTLMPVAHALMQAAEDLEKATSALSPEELWATPGGAASIGFHLKHIAGSLDRLLTYAWGGPLTEAQLVTLRDEKQKGASNTDAQALVEAVVAAVGKAIEQMRMTPPESLFEPRRVGRAGLPSTVIGLLFHAAEHAQRHTGQVITTAKIVQG